ncbi:MAG: AbgT family transporter [Saprospiraceae bacterium]|nr:AbgT family transporter [Saprospiraceae bacterium]
MKKRKIPHNFVIIFAVIVLAAIATWFVSSGEFDRTEKVLPDGSSKTIIVEGTYHKVEQSPQTWQIFSAMFKGFVKQSDIIIFILMIGGAFWIMNSSRAIDVGILAFLKLTKKLERFRVLKKLGVNNIVMVLIMTMFSIFGAVFGMSEETIAFVIILVPLSISMGYDSIVGVCLVYVAAHLGFAGAMLNPFTIGIAQGLSDIPIFSGLEYRFVCWLIINFIGFSFILLYARRVKRNPNKSIMYEADEYWRKRKANDNNEEMNYYTPKSAWITYFITLIGIVIFSFIYKKTTLTIGDDYSVILPIIPYSAALFAVLGFISLKKSVHFFILTLLAFTIIYLIIGVMGYQWYVMEIGTLFFALGILSGIAINKSANEISILFIEGVKDILNAALIVGLAGGIIVILTDGKIVDSIMNSLAGSMQGVGKTGSVGIMYVIQTAINIIIPSGSAKAALTMPIMAPFSDLIGVSRQATVMAFQFGDGFTNMITPTSGVLLGALGVAKVPYEKWVKWILPLMIILIVLGFLLLIPTVMMDLNGF